MTFTCLQCAGQFETPGDPVVFGDITITPTICNGCDDISIKLAEQERAKAIRLKRQARFAEMCPAIYQQTDVARLPKQDKAAAVIEWPFSPRGLIVSGDSDCGKTRSVWKLIERLVVEEGRSVLAMTGTDFARRVAEAYGASAEEGAAFFAQCVKADVLFWDDFGKFKVTPRVEDEILDIVEHRTSHGLPILLTTNSNAGQLKKAFSDDRREPIFRRLREFCRYVNFSDKRRVATSESLP